MTAVLQTIVLNALWQLPLLTVAGLLAERVLRPFSPIAHYRLWLTVTALGLLIPAASALPAAWLQAIAHLFQANPSAPNANVTVLTGPATAITQLHLPQTLGRAALAVYLVLTAFFAMRLLWRSVQLAQLRRDATPIPLTPELQAIWSAYETRFQTHASLVSAPGIGGPITIGLRAKLLILPQGMLETLPEDELDAILAHEFAHMRRNDFASNLALQFLALPVAFHPALWLTRSHLVQARELVCDRLAAEHTGRVVYTRSLLRLAARILANPSTPTPNAIGVFDAHPLERRLMNLTQLPSSIGRTRRLALITATIALTTLTCGTALALRVSVPTTGPIPQSESNPPKTVRIAGGVAAGNIESRVTPVYPPDAKAARIQGTVVLHAVIGKDGKIQSLHVISGPPELTNSAIDAVSQWVYKPYLLNGEPVEVETTITVTYSFGE
jgi:TonB family protein